MSHAQWPNKSYVKVFETDEVIKMGSYLPNYNEFFKNNSSTLYGGVNLHIYFQGTLAGTERIRTHIYGDSNYSGILYSSSWTNLSIITAPGSYWMGWLFTEITSGTLNKNITYYLGAEIGNYTRNGFTLFVSLKFDYPNPVYGLHTDALSDKAYAFRPISYKARVA